MSSSPATNDHAAEFVADCHVRDAADLLSHRWDGPVLMALRTGGLRRRDLRQRIGGISDKSLTESLARLTTAGLVMRTALREAPPRVQYTLSEAGAAFVDGPLVALGAWATQHPPPR